MLIGLLNKKCQKLRQYLISDYEYKHDDKEPYLNYAIRETSLYFLSDLVCRFFIDDAGCLSAEDIRKQDWYFNDYNQDPGIQSMLRAIETMEGLLHDKSEEWCMDFSYFILNQLSFMYYDMGSRQNGEETFVVINTTGEPLSATQNLKPLVIQAAINTNSANVVARWEDMETWFWQRRCTANGNDTAERGFREFLSWIEIAECKDEDTLQQLLKSRDKFTFHYDRISFDTIESYYRAVKYIFEDQYNLFKTRFQQNWLSPKEPLPQIDGFRLWPVISYVQHISIEHMNERNLRRFYEFIKNLSALNKVKSNPGDYIFEALQMALSCDDVVELADQSDSFPKLMSAEETEKLTILKNSGKEREAIEQAFWQLQGFKVPGHRIWAGEIGTVINWSKDLAGVFHLEAFKKYSEIFDHVFAGECDANIDLTRRALITCKLNNYPLGNYSFGWEWDDWKQIITNNAVRFKAFFDELLAAKDIAKAQQDMINNMPETDDWSEFAKCPYLLDYCNQKHIACWQEHEVLLLKRKHAEPFSIRNAHLYYALGNSWETSIMFMGWRMWPWANREGGCVVFEEDKLHIFIDVCCRHNNYTVQIGSRSCEQAQAAPQACIDYLQPFIPQDDDTFSPHERRFKAEIPWEGDYQAIKTYVGSVIGHINSLATASGREEQLS